MYFLLARGRKRKRLKADLEGDLNYVSDGSSVVDIRQAFEIIFDRLGQKPHFDMMIERARLE